MSFSDLLALRKAKLGGKYKSPEGIVERGQPDVENQWNREWTLKEIRLKYLQEGQEEKLVMME